MSVISSVGFELSHLTLETTGKQIATAPGDVEDLEAEVGEQELGQPPVLFFITCVSEAQTASRGERVPPVVERSNVAVPLTADDRVSALKGVEVGAQTNEWPLENTKTSAKHRTQAQYPEGENQARAFHHKRCIPRQTFVCY
eukprot:CAMPEP_0204293810 /NCGR_PEP_ID=MMETSP0468-20130131/66854_1 /ASSEMBLY_ACC=CAM_ASM_000383 /TAXON_ID=2969 /ORGANISM="Oxyrrhis marina" /LENGTH=141 /DNA_ID=CAMNT_0051272301 /DNA_START=166 /DNA_END=589 /DNA_ORIENTATION=+